MRRAVRVGLVVLGAAMAVYGAASLTGGWLGTPPWWERAEPLTVDEWDRRYYAAAASDYIKEDRPGLPVTGDAKIDRHIRSGPVKDLDVLNPDKPWNRAEFEGPRHMAPRKGREWTSCGVVAVGAALISVGAWPRRRRPVQTPVDAL